ncbi:MAG: putative teichuronic acid biosynthesis glycosyltransferase TuaC [Candidatus Thorarchaeota archaeon]|nr:MAG: putative teichuronic acid biosynthesis glycosyltransferase TuaC [Candidatus Thorarchaeota archaeon]
MKQISVGRFCTRIFPDRGGPAKHAHKLSEALEHIGVKNCVIASKYCKKRSADRIYSFHPLPICSPSTQTNPLSMLLFTLSFFVLGILYSLVYFLRSRVDLIHAHSPAISGIISLAVSKILRKPLIITIHGFAGPKLSWAPNSGSYIEFLLEKTVLRNADHVITVSPDYRHLIELYSPQTSYSIIGNGVDIEYFSPASGDDEKKKLLLELGLDESSDIVTWVGNLNLEEKVRGVRDLIQAIDILVNLRKIDCDVLLVGGGTHIDQISALINQYNLEQSVHLLGFRDDIQTILQASDIFVLPSHHEGSPNSLLEALSCGVVSIATHVGGVPRILGDTGYLFRPGDSETLARHLQHMLANPDDRHQLSLKSRSRAESALSWETIAHKTTVQYQLLI